MANWQHCPAVERANEQNGGLWVFKGTDVPLYRLYEHLAAGGTVSSFAQQCSLGAKQAMAALNYEADELHDFRSEFPSGVPEMHNPKSKATGPDDAIWRTCTLVEQVPGILGGVWVFNRSRFTLYAIYYNLASGATVDDLTEWYCVDRDKVVGILQHQSNTLRESRTAYADTV